MRIAFIVEKFPNISETFILDEIVGAIRRGFEVDIFALSRGGVADIHPAYEEFRLGERTFYCVPAGNGRRERVLAALPATLMMFIQHPRAFIACARSRRRGIQSRTFVTLACAFVRSMHRYDVVHAHFGPNGVRAEVLRAANIFDAPIVTTFHGYDATSFVAKNGTSAYRELAERGECFIAVSESIAREMRAIGMPEGRTRLMPLGVDCRIWGARAFASSKRPLRVLSVGRFVEKKGFDFGIRAVVEARRRGAQMQYDIVGDGDLRPELEATIERLNAKEFVVLHGFKNQTEVATFLEQSDVMLVPSVTALNGDKEGLPVVVKEAMARGLPVVASRHAGIPEIVDHHHTGLLADERDWAGLATHLALLAADEGERQRLGNAGRALIERAYDNETLVDDLVALYRRLADGPTHDAVKADNRVSSPGRP